jgi:hypothetical protein
MEYALSLQDGLIYPANALTIPNAKELKLVCPVCKEKVFKKMRTVGSEIHFFSHHKGVGTSECELYHSSPPHSGSREIVDGTPLQSQSFKIFVAEIARDIQNLLVVSGAITSPIEEARLSRISISLDMRYFAERTTSLSNVEQNTFKVLNDAGILNHALLTRIVSAVAGYFQRPSARFIDNLMIAWTLYSLGKGKTLGDSSDALKLISSGEERFEMISILFIAGICSRYAKLDTIWFGESFRSACSHFAANLSGINQPTGLSQGLRDSSRDWIEQGYPGEIATTKRVLRGYGFQFNNAKCISPSGEILNADNVRCLRAILDLVAIKPELLKRPIKKSQ